MAPDLGYHNTPNPGAYHLSFVKGYVLYNEIREGI